MYKRQIIPDCYPTGDELSAHLIGIGFRLQGRALPEQNIENALFAASLEGMNGDLRVLSLLVDWLDIHLDRVIADRLFRLASSSTDTRARAFWKSIAQWKKSDPRLKKYLKLYRGPRIDLLPSGTEFHISRSGEDKRFQGTCLRVPAGAGLRHRPEDILSPAALAKRHRSYYWRLIIGSTYRADMWAALERNPEQSPYELARACYGSYATAWQVKNERKVLKEAA